MKIKYFGWLGLLAGKIACTSAPDSGKLAVPLEGVWEGQSCASVETNAAGRRVFARTDQYKVGEVVCEVTPTEVLHFHGGRIQMRTGYTRSPGGFRLMQKEGMGTVQVPDNNQEVSIEELTPTRLVVRQAIPSSDTTTLTSTIIYARKAQF